MPAAPAHSRHRQQPGDDLRRLIADCRDQRARASHRSASGAATHRIPRFPVARRCRRRTARPARNSSPRCRTGCRAAGSAAADDDQRTVPAAARVLRLRAQLVVTLPPACPLHRSAATACDLPGALAAIGDFGMAVAPILPLRDGSPRRRSIRPRLVHREYATLVDPGLGTLVHALAIWLEHETLSRTETAHIDQSRCRSGSSFA